MTKVFITHPRVRNVKGELYKTGEQDVAQKVADSLVKRGLAKQLEVATPSSDKKSAKELQEEIKASMDIDFLNSMLDDERKSVVEAAEKRLAEIKPAE